MSNDRFKHETDLSESRATEGRAVEQQVERKLGRPGNAEQQRRKRNGTRGAMALIGVVLLVIVWVSNDLLTGGDQGGPLQLAYQNRIGSAACIIAVEQKLFQKEGVDVEGLSFNSGPSCSEALYSGSADIGTMGDTTAIITASRRGPYRIVGSHGAGEHRHRLVAREQASIRSAADLVGQTLAVKKGTSTYGGLLAWLAACDVRPTAIRILDMRPSEMPDALAAGSIDAFVASEPTPSLAEMRGAKEVVTLGGLGNQYPILILAHAELLRSRAAEARAVLRALHRAIRFINDHPAEAARIVGRSTGLPAPVVKTAMQRHAYRLSLDDQIMQSLRATARFLKEQGTIQTMPDFEACRDSSYLPQ